MAQTDARLNHELFKRYEGNPILSVNEWPYGANSVFNAAAARVDGKTVLLVRVEDFRGISHFTVARSAGGLSNWDIDPSPTLLPDPQGHPEELWGIEDPARLRYRTDEWILGPKARYEREGDVDDVVFPCGWTLESETVHMYYGAADSCIAYATAKLDDLVTYVKKYS
jgi:predicted GH43/DUF377 family glycosyl hydrolase